MARTGVMADTQTTSAVPTFAGTAFGLVVRSDLALPELRPADPTAPADVEIAFAPVPAELPDATVRGARFQAAPGRVLLQIDGVARYLASAGRSILIDRDPMADDDDLRVFLLGSLFGAILQQRGDLVLHGSATLAGEDCVAFVGPSGAGKSTLAAAFRQRGHATLTDDLCVVRPMADGKFAVHPGYPQAKLWHASLEKLALPRDGLKPIRAKLDKWSIPLGQDFARAPARLRRIYVLNPYNEPGIRLQPLEGARKFESLAQTTYRFLFLPDPAAKSRHFALAMRLAQEVPVTLVQRPLGDFQLDELVARVEEDLRT